MPALNITSRGTRVHIVMVLLAASLLLADSAWSVDSTPLKINFQGRLTDSTGAPVNGSREMNFRYYDAATNGNLLYAEARGGGNPVTVTLGNYAVELGAATWFGGSKANFSDSGGEWPYGGLAWTVIVGG
ncbi:MAG: hypothetical protein HY719_15545 [Planctomycetes bacterium]|nr:hypothetical protein [Planctomycetota bacterium]